MNMTTTLKRNLMPLTISQYYLTFCHFLKHKLDSISCQDHCLSEMEKADLSLAGRNKNWGRIYVFAIWTTR